MCTFFQDARWGQIGPRGLVNIQCFQAFSTSLVVQRTLFNLAFMLSNSGNLLFVCVNTDEKYKFISSAILSSWVISFPSFSKSTKSFVPFRFDFI